MTEDQRERGIYEPYQGKLSDTRVVPLQNEPKKASRQLILVKI